MKKILNLDKYPLDQTGSTAWQALVDKCVAELEVTGMFNLDGFILPAVAAQIATDIAPAMATQSFQHKRSHNIYFKSEIAGLAPDHPALQKVETINHTICADQIPQSLVIAIYEYPPFLEFLAATMGRSTLYAMQDPLARVNVMAYRNQEALNWHFDRSEFTITLMLQEPKAGGVFEYRSNLRTATDPNYEGVAALLQGRDSHAQSLRLKAGTLSVFKGKNTAHRVTPIQGDVQRMIAVLSYYESPGVQFSDEERMGFYGRIA